ncbi:YciI family protein [Bacillus taeanensis]|uniref:YCII-related domain-containing protein n=1 Tax=Bacillus taeanensis TaxID=273032 RepID=A0A366XZY7_9BACI|nr:YciI family protein [Bacillus taeanensis]RBW69481.1 hypothetical protein DS031_11195 [Bacillus taeanensis]
MNYYAVFLSMRDEELSQKYRPEHLAYLEKLTEEGKVFTYGRFADGAGGLIIYQADSLEEATAYAKEDPYVQLKARDFEIHEWVFNKEALYKAIK